VNLCKSREVQLSLLNDESLEEIDLLLVSELYIFDIGSRPAVHAHHMWTPVLPSERAEGVETQLSYYSFI
jgi:hypothetical protein